MNGKCKLHNGRRRDCHFRAPLLDLPLRMNANMLRARIPASPKQSNNQITKPNL